MVAGKRMMWMTTVQGGGHMPKMLMRLLLHIALLFLLMGVCLPTVSIAAGGDYLWAPYNVAAAGNQEARASRADSQGNLIIVGSTDSNGTDIHVAKVKADGSGTLWSVSKDGTGEADVATAVIVDSNDDVIVTGYVWDGPTYNDIYTAKYAAADGALIWEHTFDGTGNGNDYPTAITVDEVGNVFVAGYMQNPSTKDSIILLKYDPNIGPNPDGTPLWEISYDSGNGGHDRAYAIVADDVHGVVVTGESQNLTPDFDCLTVKYDTSGNQVWTRRYADNGDGRGQALAMDADGNVVMAGYASNGSNLDFYVVEYAADDSPAKWVDIYDSGYDDKARALWLDADDNVYVVGSDSTLTTGSDIHVAKYDGVTGIEAWSDSYNSGDGHNESGLDIVGDSDGELFVVGYKNDGVGGLDDVLAMKVKKDDGTQLWLKEYDGAGKSDRGLCACLAPDGNLIVGARSDRWTSGSSDYDFLALKFESGALNQPTSLTATVVSNTEIDLTWSDNSAGEDNFILERKIGDHGSYAAIVTLAADTESYSDSGLTPDTRYYYRVMATSAATGNTPYSNEVNAKTTIISYAAPSLHFEYGGTAAGDDYAEGIAVGADNHPVVTGFVTNVSTGFDYYTIKFDRADLTEQWNATYNDDDNEVDVATAVTVDSSNRVVVSGYSSLYGGGAGNTNDVYTIGYPADGSVESWTDQYNGPDGNDDRSSSVAAAIDGSDNVVVVGYGKNDLFNDDIYVIKYLPDGTRNWAIAPFDGGNDDYPAAVAFDLSGNVLVGGYTHNGTNKDFFVAKYNGSTGDQVWQKSFNGAANGDDFVNALAVDADGNLYVTGSSVNASGNSDIYTIKYAAADATLLWEKGFNGSGNGYDIGEGITFDPVDNGIMVGGTTFVATDNHDYLLIRYAADGSVIWQKTLDRPGSDEALYAMSIDSSGTVALTGTTDSGGNNDVLTVRYDSDGIIIGASVYNGAADNDDTPSSIATNAYGETFVAGITITASGDTDYMVFLAAGETMQSPTPFTATQLYTEVDLNWTDNSLNEAGFDLERKLESCDSVNPWTALHTAAADETGYSNTGLSVGSTFCYRIRSFNASGESSRWAELGVTTVAPLAPSGLSATVQNTTEILLEWTDNTGSEDGFTLERCLGVGCDFSTGTDLNIAADATSYTDASVCAGQAYGYRIKAYKTNEWVTGVSNVAADALTDSPVAPTDFVVSLVSEIATSLGWTDNSDDETGFKIERCVGSGCSDFAEIGSVAADEMSFSNTGLQPNTLYRYRVTPYKTSICSVDPAYSVIQEVTTTPALPGSFNATVVASTQVDLDWTDNTASEDGFKVERCLGAACSDFSQLAITAAGVTLFVDDSVCSGSTYRYRIRAYKSGLWDSAYTTIADAVVGSPPLPTDFAVTAISEEGIELAWSIGWTDPHGYLVERCSGVDCVDVAPLDDIPSDGSLTEEYSDTGLLPDSTYGYRVRSYRNDDCAGDTPAESGTTAIGYATTLAPPPPTGLALTSPNSTQVDLSWLDNTDSETGFVVERCLGSGIACDEDSEFALLSITAEDVTSYADQTTCSGTTYTYRVAAEKTNGPIWQTSWDVSDSETTASPVTPADFAATAVSEVQIDLAWTDDIADEGSYRVEKCVGSGIACDEDSEFSLLVQYDNRNLPEEAALWLKMDEASWGTVINSGIAGADGVRYGNAAIQANIDGRDRVGWFDGYGDYLQFNHYAEINPSAAITVSTWAKSFNATWQHDHALLTKRNAFILGPRAADTGMRFYIFAGGIWRSIDVPGAVIAAAFGGSFDITEWHHYAGSYDGANLILYVDGVEVGRTPYVGSIGADTGVLQVGRDDGYNSYHKGWLDDAMIYDRALTASEVASLYLLGADSGYQDQGLSPATDYSYRLRAAKTASCSWTTGWELTTATTMEPPAPTDFTIAATDTTSLAISWTDNSGSETAYNLERCSGSGTACDEDGEFSPVLDAELASGTTAELIPDTISYSDSTVCENGTYSYRVRAEKSDGPIWQTTWLGPAAQTAVAKVTPTGLSATRISEAQIDLAWSDSNSDETGFKLERCVGTDCGDFVELVTVGAGTSSYQDGQLDPDTSYSYRLKAYKTADCPWETAYTATATAFTEVLVPSGLAASAINTTRIDLGWTDNTVTETSFQIERCIGSGCGDFSDYVEVGPNLTSYSDTAVCYGTSYNYRLKVKNEGLSFSGGSCWTRKVPSTFSAFVAGANALISVPYDTDMRADFGDVRFYDEDGKRELAFGIKEMEPGVAATFVVKLGPSENISLYYGNADATHSGDLGQFIEFEDDFAGTAINGGKWLEIDPNNSIGQNDDLLLIDVSDAWDKALISQATFNRAAGKEFYASLTIPADTDGNNHFMLGWELNQTSDPSYTQLVHGFYWNNYAFGSYEKGGSIGATGTYTVSTAYQMKVVLKAVGAKYYVKGGAYADWTLVKETSAYNDALMRVAITQYSHQANIHSLKLFAVLSDVGASLGAEEINACYSYANTWELGYSNQDEATTSSPVAPSGLTATALNDTQIDLSWSDNTDVETGFKIERCSGSGCSDFVQIDTVAGGVESYSDLTVEASIDYSYRVRAYKDSSCPWDSAYSGTASAQTFPAASNSLTATALNSRMVKLEWDDNASDEDGFEVEVQVFSGDFVKVVDLPANSVSYVDTASLDAETEYVYRIRPYRGVDTSPYSNQASAVTLSYSDGDSTCPP